MNLDKTWMQVPRYLPEYAKGVEEFIEHARPFGDTSSSIRCPCNRCKNRYYKHIDVVYRDLRNHGIDKGYTNWVHHGETLEVLRDTEDSDEGEHYGGLEDMFEDICAPLNMDGPTTDTVESETNGVPYSTEESPQLFEELLHEARQPLYPNCEKFSMLDFLVKLLHLKTINCWSNKSFNSVLELIKKALPEGEKLPKSYYEAKSLMRSLGLGYIPIHACQKDCVLFWKEYETLDTCPKCGGPRYKASEGKSKKVPLKVLRYFPLKPRLQRLFMSRMTAEDMRWHKEKRVREENVYRHPADSKAWEEFDKEHEWFANDCRNVRLGLATDGFNPFGNMSNAYSMWPVMVMPYNLPPWKCMKEPFLFMSLLIPGPKSPGNDIDVYLQPLIDELNELWCDGVETYDAVTKKTFSLHAALLWTINDFPAYANLSGWSTKGKMACPNCNKDTHSMYLKISRKLCYMNHTRFLRPSDSLRRNVREVVNGINESRLRPKTLSGHQLLSQLRHIQPQAFGKAEGTRKRKRSEVELNWTKKSILYQLPYWGTLKLRHNLDVMHVEKNICDNVLGTILGLDGKTKDTIKSRLDLKMLGIREELHPVQTGNKYVIPHASYTLSSSEKKIFCEWLKEVKFPDGFASNISRCVSTHDCKISGMKSHDCHVLLQRLLPVALRGFLSSDISVALIQLGLFFKELCSKTLKLDFLEKMEKDIAIILVKLEHIFPPSFFDVMVHLAIHLPREAILGGPVHYRWMYPIERFLRELKQYVRNKARPEGSIAEAYVDKECLTFCSMYLQGIETRFNREDRNYDGGQDKQGASLDVFKKNVRPYNAYQYLIMDPKDYDKACYYVLNNSDDVAPYLEEHLKESGCQSTHIQEKTFAKWFQKRIQILRNEKSPQVTDELYSLALGPDKRVKRYNSCIVNGIRFNTKDRDVSLRTQNSGVVVHGEHQSKDTEFYGVLTDIIELSYTNNNLVYLFKCNWFNVENRRTGIRSDSYFKSINVSKTWYKDDQFVLASQANQVFYLRDTKLRGDWMVVQEIKPRNTYDVVEAEGDIRGEHLDIAYQQEEQLAVNGITQDENESVPPLQLNRRDDVPLEVELDVVNANFSNIPMDDSFIVDNESDGEDDTLINYCSEGDDNESCDNDTDIEP